MNEYDYHAARSEYRRRVLQGLPTNPLDQLAQRTRAEEARSLARRVWRAHLEQLLRESRALRAAADLRHEARLSDQGQLVSALRRGLSG